jgi:hypothetical protein
LTAPIAGTDSHNVLFTPTDTNNYKIEPTSVDVIVDKANPTITGLTASSITYGQTVGSSIISGTSSVPGSFAFMSLTAPNAGTSTHNVLFTPTDTNNYNTVEIQNVSVIVDKATPTIRTLTVSNITYGQPIGNNILSGTASIPGSFTFISLPPPSVGTASYNVLFTPEDNNNYKTVTTSVSVIVDKATPTITGLTASSITYGQTLENNILSGKSSVPGSFAFTQSITPNAVKDNYNVIFTPTEDNNYNTVGTSVSVTVNKATPTVITLTASNITYGETLRNNILSGTASTPGVFRFLSLISLNAGTSIQNVLFIPEDTNNYNVASTTVSVTVNKATPIIKIVNATYNRLPQYANINGGIATNIKYNGSTNEPISAGTYRITADIAESINYNSGNVDATFEITKKEISIINVNILPKTYDGTNNANVTGTLLGVIPGDGVILTGTYNTMNAGINTVNFGLSGTSSGNYKLVDGNYKVSTS